MWIQVTVWRRRLLNAAFFSCFQVVGAYDFTARSKHEVSFRAGEPVRILEPHDKRGSPEWSLVEVRGGQRGYVPSNYLAIMPVGAGLPPNPGFFL